MPKSLGGYEAWDKVEYKSIFVSFQISISFAI